jgi:hypothetical protein
MNTDELRSGVRKALAVAYILFVAAPCFAQHAGLRQQWQPQTESDPRLQQPVEIEILGRAAVTGLPLLAEETGVSLCVAPEDLATVGERKFTVIAKGCTLKAIMVQLAEALQECHWDVDVSGEQRAYLLHRNAGADFTVIELEQTAEARQRKEQRTVREARLEEARRALKMMPEELAELEKTDVLLARAVRDRYTRTLMEGVLSLAPEEVQAYREGGRVFIYAQAPEAVRKAAEAVADTAIGRLAEEPGVPAEEMSRWRERGSHVMVSFSDEGCEFGFGVRCLVVVPVGGQVVLFVDTALPARFVSTDDGAEPEARLLMATGAPDEAAARRIIAENEREGQQLRDEREQARRREAWVEPADPELLKTVGIGDQQFRSLTEVQQFLAQQTGLSVISDYFTRRGVHLSDEVRAEQPLWWALYLLGDSTGYWWRKAGPCLVFRDAEWYRSAQAEIPEWLLFTYQRKYQEQGELTLDDVAAFAVALGDRPPPIRSFPQDLVSSGLFTVAQARWSLTLYASLSPEQQAKARSAAGLSYADMTIAQRQQIAEAATRTAPPTPPDEVSQATFHITDTTAALGDGESAAGLSTTQFRAQFPSGKYEEGVVRRRAVKAGS